MAACRSSVKCTEPSPVMNGWLETPLIALSSTRTPSNRLGRKGSKVTSVCAAAPVPRATTMKSPLA